MEEESITQPVTSPTLPTNDGVITSEKAFSGAMTLDLTDEQIAHAIRVMMPIREKYLNIFRRKFNDPTSFTLDEAMDMVEQFEDEIRYELADKCQVIASVDATPLIEGKPLAVEWVGVLSGHDLSKHGMDHERKQWEVTRASREGLDYYGQKK